MLYRFSKSWLLDSQYRFWLYDPSLFSTGKKIEKTWSLNHCCCSWTEGHTRLCILNANSVLPLSIFWKYLYVVFISFTTQRTPYSWATWLFGIRLIATLWITNLIPMIWQGIHYFIHFKVQGGTKMSSGPGSILDRYHIWYSLLINICTIPPL